MPIIDVANKLCPLCETPIGAKPFVATWGVPFVPPHRLYEYCEATMHYECLEGWADRVEFSLGYFHQFVGTDERRNGYILARTENWVLMCGMYQRITREEYPMLKKLRVKQWLETYMPFFKKPYPDFVPTEAEFRVGRIGPAYAQVLIADWPMRLYGSFNNWTQYANGEFRGNMVGGALAAAEKVMSEVRQIAPDLSALERLIEKLEAKNKDVNHA
jgi:hypothetical protein